MEGDPSTTNEVVVVSSANWRGMTWSKRYQEWYVGNVFIYKNILYIMSTCGRKENTHTKNIIYRCLLANS